jgi:uncharacterized repeat protein (TIGR03943 family)
MRREAQSVVLLLVGGAVIRTGLDGTYERYVRAEMRPFLLATGVLFAAVGLLELARALQANTAASEPADGHAHGRDVAWLLAAPMLVLLLLAPPALGSFAAERSGTAVGDPPADAGYPPLPDGDPVRLSVLDYANRAVFERGASLAQRRVMLTGFVTTDRTGTRYLTRMAIACCAADARPVKVGLSGRVPRDLGRDRWIEVTGRYDERVTRDGINQARIPFLYAETVSLIPAPQRPYET